MPTSTQPPGRPTIAALSTGRAPASRAIVRISGPHAQEILNALFEPTAADPREQPRMLCPGRLTIPIGPPQTMSGPPIDGMPAWAACFPPQSSLTGEPMAEVHLPGLPLLVEAVLSAASNAGARPAAPGEFTRRALEAGRITLHAAEALAQALAARNDAQLRAAAELRSGALPRAIGELANELASLLALLEAGIDFVDEHISFIPADQLAEGLTGIEKRIGRILDQSTTSEQLEQIPLAVLVGLPNAGKSTLFNALTQLHRAICSPIEGTTRDVLHAPLAASLSREPVLLADTAGLLESTDHILARLAEQASRRAIQRADLLVLVANLADPAAPDHVARLRCLPELAEAAGRPTLLAATHSDCLDFPDVVNRAAALQDSTGLQVIPVAAPTGQGISTLAHALGTRAGSAAPVHTAQTALLDRHRTLLQAARDDLHRARDIAMKDGPVELIAADLRSALDHLNEMTGAHGSDDVLGRVFQQFCIGK